MSTALETDELATPIGPVWLVVHDGALCAVEFTDRVERVLPSLRARFGEIRWRRAADPAGMTGRLRAYFGGELDALQGLAADTGGTGFERQVWAALRGIPVGHTMSYGALAAQLGLKGAARAVGLANGRNPVAIVIPCHRVIGADGSLTGYGGGLDRKLWLLEHEGACLPLFKAARRPTGLRVAG